MVPELRLCFIRELDSLLAVDLEELLGDLLMIGDEQIVPMSYA